MGLSNAMNTGVTGLGINAEAITVVGNNIANVNTVGFKEGRTLFSDALSQNMDAGQVGRGGQVQTIQNNFAQSSFENSSNVTDLALQGNSFFALKDPTVTAPLTSQSQAVLSRAGAFSVDSNNYLVNPDGYQVVDTAGNPIQFPDKATTLIPVMTTFNTQITSSQVTMAAATPAAIYNTPSTTAKTALDIAKTAATAAQTAALAALAAATGASDATSMAKANVAVNNAVTAVADIQAAIDLAAKLTSNATAATAATTALTNAQTELNTTKNSSNAITANTANTNAMSALSAAQDAMVALKAAMSKGYASFNAAATALTSAATEMTTNATAGAAAATTAGTTATTAATTLNTATGTLNTSLVAATTTYNAAKINSDIATNTYDNATAQAFSKVAKVSPDGLITFTGLQGDSYYYDASKGIGILTATATPTQIAAAQRLAVIKAANPGGLEKMGGTLFSITNTAGVSTTAFSLSDNKLNGVSDQLLSNSLELSNVDMATQLVNMIKLQRAYSGNSKVITTSDDMLQETLSLKR